jgi:peptidyl-tRNA hydrolase, PTH1 family
MALFGRGDRPERRGTPADFLVVGLGNPGAEYAHSRHNAGADAVGELARRGGATLKRSKERALSAEVTMHGRRLALAFPQTYVNLSGESVVQLVRRYGIEDPSQIVVVHDELDLAPGVLKVKVGGGLAGHNGLRSLKQHLHTDEFVRVRIGVGKPPSKERGADHVLKQIPKAEKALIDVCIQEAADAVELIATDGPEAAMNRYNGRSLP